MKKEIKQIVIGKHEAEQKNYLQNVEDKTKSFKTLFDYLATFVPIDNIESFEGKINDEFYSRCYDKYHVLFPTLTLPKILELHSCQIHKVDALIQSFESIALEWDFAKNQPLAAAPDFNIYANTENEIKLFTYLSELIKVQEKVKSLGIQFNPAPFIQSFPFAMYYDFITNEIKPNTSFIKGTIR
jgi:hypothetical protein